MCCVNTRIPLSADTRHAGVLGRAAHPGSGQKGCLTAARRATLTVHHFSIRGRRARFERSFLQNRPPRSADGTCSRNFLTSTFFNKILQECALSICRLLFNICACALQSWQVAFADNMVSLQAPNQHKQNNTIFLNIMLTKQG